MNDLGKIALVTGATGFVGKALVRRLQDEGWEVHAIVRPSSRLEPLQQQKDRPVRYHEYTGYGHEIATTIQTVKPSVVFHLASLFLAQHQYTDIDRLIQSNITLGTQLVDAMVANGIFNLVNTGTSWQHFKNEAYNPVCLYAATKQAFESILEYYQVAKGLRSITLKLFDTYGPHDSRGKLISLLAKNAMSQERLEMSPGEQQLDLVYIDDVVDAFLLAAQYVQQGECLADFAVSSGNPIPLKEVAKMVESVTGKKLNIVWGGRPYREREVMHPWNNGRMLPGWVAKVSLEEGLKKTLRSELER